jgi:hypothetical protein
MQSNGSHKLYLWLGNKLGSIATSGGLIYAGIANTLSTLQQPRNWLPIYMFSIFSVWVVLLVVLQPCLSVPDQITPFLLSFLWMALAIFLMGAAMVFVLRFIRQQHPPPAVGDPDAQLR